MKYLIITVRVFIYSIHVACFGDYYPSSFWMWAHSLWLIPGRLARSGGQSSSVSNIRPLVKHQRMTSLPSTHTHTKTSSPSSTRKEVAQPVQGFLEPGGGVSATQQQEVRRPFLRESEYAAHGVRVPKVREGAVCHHHGDGLGTPLESQTKGRHQSHGPCTREQDYRVVCSHVSHTRSTISSRRKIAMGKSVRDP